MSFFRKEVHAHQSENWLGSVNLVSTRVGWLLAVMLFGGALALLSLLVFGKYTRSESVDGQIVPEHGLIRVSSPQAGTIAHLAVAEGDRVDAGEILVEISIERDSALGGRVGEAVAIELLDQKRRLQAELDGLEQQQERELKRLDTRLASLNRQRHLANEQIDNRQRQLRSAQALVDQIEPIRSSGHLTAMQIHQFESVMLDAETQLDLAELQRETIEQETAATQAELTELPARISDQRNELAHTLAEISAAIVRNAGERSVVIRAPLDGTVSGLTIRRGQSVDAGRQFLAIVPQASEFVAELWVPARAVGRIEPGGRVAMRYEAFPFRQFGQQYGRIREISERALLPEELLGVSGIARSEPSYRVVVELDRQYVAQGAHRRVLRSNMTLQASLLLDRRRLIDLTGLRMPERVAAGPNSVEMPVAESTVDGGRR